MNAKRAAGQGLSPRTRIADKLARHVHARHMHANSGAVRIHGARHAFFPMVVSDWNETLNWSFGFCLSTFGFDI